MKTNLENIKDSGFKVPKGYFKDVEDSIVSNTKLKNSIDVSGFNVPDGYFNTVENEILQKVSPKETKVVSLFNKQNIIYAIGIAALLVLMISVFNTQSKLDIENIDTASIESYLSDEGLNTYELASLFTEEEFAEVSFTDSNMSDETIETYLLENINLEDIIE